MRFDQFLGGSYEAAAKTADCERTINWYPSVVESPNGAQKAMLLPTPGVTVRSSVTGAMVEVYAPGRAHFAMASREFAVFGIGFHEIDRTGARTYIGQVSSSPYPASISSNGDAGSQLFIASGPSGECYNLTTGAFTSALAMGTGYLVGDYLEGYFLALASKNSTLYISNLLNGATWTTGTDFAQRSLAPDPWISMKVYGRFIWLLGEQTSEAWYNTGATFPFAPHPSGVIAYGCMAPFTPKVVRNELIWLARTPDGKRCVVKVSGFTPQVISTHALEAKLQEMDHIEDAVADSYSDENGHTFYMLHFEADAATWAYDAETGIWSERGTWISEENRWQAWRPRWLVDVFGEQRMLDSRNGDLYAVGPEFTTDVDSRPIRRLRCAPAPYDEDQRIRYSELELDLEPATTTSATLNPQVMLRLSNDGGKTWGNEHWASGGKIGEYLKRVHWHRLGIARRRAFEITASDAVPWRLTGAYLEAEVEEGRV